jgi:hypothetical protein
MQYLLLIYTDETSRGAAPEEVIREMYAAYGEFTRELKAAGKLGHNEELDDPVTARSVRLRDGQPLATDGPYAETREQLAGFYQIEAADMEEAVRWASKIPSAAHGTIEVRPVKDNSAYYQPPG